MSTVLAISDDIKTLAQVQQSLGVQLSEDPQFFVEWLIDSGTGIAPLSEESRLRLDQARRNHLYQNYLYQSEDGPLLEETIKLVILSPILELAGFYQAPYKFRAEVSVEIEAIGDREEILRGRIDGLVLLEQLWIVLIESKKTIFDLELALPQTLAYMAATPTPDRPMFAMVTNGSSYLFVKLVGREYAVSDLFGLRSQHHNNLYQVLQILKRLGQAIV
jgi:hypothetical protein